MVAKEQFLSQRQRYQPITLPQEFSDEEMARDWTLSENDKQEIGKYWKSSRLFIAIQLCAVRLYGRFSMRSTSYRLALSITSMVSWIYHRL